jgi:hypothetical protein
MGVEDRKADLEVNMRRTLLNLKDAAEKQTMLGSNETTSIPTIPVAPFRRTYPAVLGCLHSPLFEAFLKLRSG